VVGEFVALLVTVRLPLMAAPLVGAKATVKVVPAPAARLNGSAGPVTLKPAPVTVVWVIFTLPVPAFVSVTVWVAVVPSFTFPKLSLLVLAFRM